MPEIAAGNSTVVATISQAKRKTRSLHELTLTYYPSITFTLRKRATYFVISVESRNPPPPADRSITIASSPSTSGVAELSMYGFYRESKKRPQERKKERKKHISPIIPRKCPRYGGTGFTTIIIIIIVDARKVSNANIDSREIDRKRGRWEG